ncbi:MAG TPA: hypothetical protein VNV15_06460 [Opitutaceae bacterium]|jgi:hypothetical protein|nr:hypothetical protein [Opitutaceae bacterium]
MRIFRFWSKVEESIEVGGAYQRMQCYGGSNVSVDEAKQDARQRLARVLRRIAGENLRKEEYEADIREEILAKLDDQNIVTRNRYGAEVLNSSGVMFVDIDEPKYRFWDIFSGAPSIEHKKERIVDFVKRRFTSPELHSLGVRLYETHNGIRAIITGQKFDPKSPDTRKLMRSLNADSLYSLLCKKQGCFRARLTPKPSRMKCRTLRIVFPREDAGAEATLKAWLAEYERIRASFSTCRFICTAGNEYSDPVIEYHDKATGAFSGLNLA